ncbi:DUF433 domain-containing protein [Catellatospora sp. NPDC049609]|uniref:DUF433 domain-containing protein n=1 Tax=Catellatospora sp. NPDC049609 TaxID=3155505 RepID=UPI00341C4691
MAYSEALTAALGGVTVHQLRGWRSGAEPLLVPEAETSGRSVRYSYLDLLAVRTVGLLRAAFSLQKIRKAVGNLHGLSDVDHLGRYVLLRDGESIVWERDEEYSVDLLRRPGQQVLVTGRDVLEGFEGWSGVQVVPLRRPKPGISITDDVMDGFPVIEDTRVPYDTIAGLANDGLDASNIRYFYPAVTDEGVTGAVAFEDYVNRYNKQAA